MFTESLRRIGICSILIPVKINQEFEMRIIKQFTTFTFIYLVAAAAFIVSGEGVKQKDTKSLEVNLISEVK